MGELHAQPDYPRGLTFEHVWAALMEDREHLRETERILKETAESQKETAESQKEYAEQQKKYAEQHNADIIEIRRILKKSAEEHAERIKEIERINKETSKIVGNLGNRFGEVIESMVEPNLLVKFSELGLDFIKIHHGTKIKDKEGNIIAQVDFSLENDEKVMLVEVKVKLDIDDIEYHLTRIEKMRTHADLHGEKQVLLGAVAGIVISDNVRNFALKKGLYIIQPSGETFIITEPKGIYSPQEWCWRTEQIANFPQSP